MDIQETIRLETYLLTPEARRDAATLEKLIADDFVEFASTGESFGKSTVIEKLPLEPSTTTFTGADFKVRQIAEGVALVTFKVSKATTAGNKQSLRSSLWVWRNGRWQMTFHQGTVLNS